MASDVRGGAVLVKPVRVTRSRTLTGLVRAPTSRTKCAQSLSAQASATPQPLFMLSVVRGRHAVWARTAPTSRTKCAPSPCASPSSTPHALFISNAARSSMILVIGARTASKVAHADWVRAASMVAHGFLFISLFCKI